MDARDELRLNAPDRGDTARDLEVAVIGSMLIDDRCIGSILPELGAEDFYHAPYRHLFTAMKSMFLEGRPVDPMTVCGYLRDDSRQLTELMRQCMEVTPTAANAECYAQALRTESRRLRRQELGYTLSQEGDPEKQVKLIAQLNALTVDKPGSRAVPLSELFRDFTNRMRDKTPPKYLSWGMETLDKLLYAELGDLIVLGGHASSGKTLLSLLFALHQAREYRVGYYSLETSAQKIADRLVAAHAPVALSGIKRHALTAPDWVAASELIRREEQTSFEYINAAGMTVADITAMALSRRHQIVYVDYLQKLQARGDKRFEIVTAVSSDLQRLAKAHGIAVVALSQLAREQQTNKASKKDELPKYAPPSISDFRESGQIEQDADVALLLWPEDRNDYRSNRILKIGKNKEGIKADLTLEFDGLHQTMREIPRDNSRAIAAQMSSIGKSAKRSAQARERMDQVQFTPLSGEDPDMPF